MFAVAGYHAVVFDAFIRLYFQDVIIIDISVSSDLCAHINQCSLYKRKHFYAHAQIKVTV